MTTSLPLPLCCMFIYINFAPYEYRWRCSTTYLFVPQPLPEPPQMVLAETGAPAPRHRRVKKGDHLAVAICGPVEGPLLGPLWVIKSETYMGVLKSNPIAGTTTSSYTTSNNGWENETAYIAFAELFIKEMKRRGLKKALLYLDGGYEHFSLIATQMLNKANVCVKPLIASTTHMTQPLDVGFFGGFKMSVAKWFRIRQRLPNARDLPEAVESVIASMETKAHTAGKRGVLESAFAQTHLFPLTNWPDSVFEPSDHLLGLSSSDARVQAAGTLTDEEMQALLKRHLNVLTPMTTNALELTVAKKREAYLEKGMDLSRCTSLTSEDWLAAAVAKEAAAEAATAAVAQRKRLAVEKKAASATAAAARLALRTVDGIVYKTHASANKARKEASAAAAAAQGPPPKKKQKGPGGVAVK